MAILQGIEVAVVPVTSKGEPIEEALFDELPIISSHKRHQVQHEKIRTQTACVLRVRQSNEKKDVHFAVRLRAINRYEWLKSWTSDSVRVHVSIDGGSLTYTSKYKKTQLVTNRSKYIDKFFYEEVGQKELQVSGAQFEKRNSNACDIRFLDEPGDEEGDIVVKVAQGRQTKTKKAGTVVLPKKGVSKKSTGALLSDGITMFASPDLGRAKSVMKDPGESILFTRSSKAEELLFTFAYRSPYYLTEEAGGRFSSKAPSMRAGKAKSLIVAIPTPPKPQSISTVSTYHSSHSKDVYFQSASYPQSNGTHGAAHSATMYDASATKRRWLEEGDDHEDMDETEFKRRKLAGIEDRVPEPPDTPPTKPVFRGMHSHYKTDRLEQIDLTADTDGSVESKVGLKSKDIKTKPEAKDTTLVFRPSPSPAKPLDEHHQPKAMSKDPPSMSEDEIAAELREIRLQQLHAELDRRKTMA